MAIFNEVTVEQLKAAAKKYQMKADQTGFNFDKIQKKALDKYLPKKNIEKEDNAKNAIKEAAKLVSRYITEDASLIDLKRKFKGIEIPTNISNDEYCKKDLKDVDKNWNIVINKAAEQLAENIDVKSVNDAKGRLKLETGKYKYDPKRNIATFTFGFAIKNDPATLKINVDLQGEKIIGYDSVYEKHTEEIKEG